MAISEKTKWIESKPGMTGEEIDKLFEQMDRVCADQLAHDIPWGTMTPEEIEAKEKELGYK